VVDLVDHSVVFLGFDDDPVESPQRIALPVVIKLSVNGETLAGITNRCDAFETGDSPRRATATTSITDVSDALTDTAMAMLTAINSRTAMTAVQQ